MKQLINVADLQVTDLQRASSYDLFSDFEGTLVVPEISYKEWVLPKVSEREKFETEYDRRLKKAREERSAKAWEDYLGLYFGLFSFQDFKEMSTKYSVNKMFGSWCARFLKAHGYDKISLTVLTRGFATIARLFFERADVKSVLREYRVSLGSVIGSEPYLDKQGIVKGVKSVVYLKRKFVKDGHIMLGDDGEEKEFGNYSYFVNFSKGKSSE